MQQNKYPSRIDLRSDTVTKPTPEMRNAMATAAVGDDVFGDDAEMNNLQTRLATRFGKEAALFFPSGTMANQVAINVQVAPGDEVICDQFAHVYKYEGGGIASNSGASVRLLQGKRGLFSAAEVLESINKDDAHFPRTKLICLENTMNRGGGVCWSEEQMEAIQKVAIGNNLFMHLDGARWWNAHIATGLTAIKTGQLFDSISVCFSKGLGCPVGSMLLGNKEFIYRAHRVRKRMGGGMRQVGILAAACNYALDNHIQRLANDHRKTLEVYEILQNISWVKEIWKPQTNVLLFKVESEWISKKIQLVLHEKNILITDIGGGWIRFVFHLDITEEMCSYVKEELLQIAI